MARASFPPRRSSAHRCGPRAEARRRRDPMRVAFDTTVLWSAFFSPTGPSFSLLALAAQRSPVFDGSITDVVGAEFWWRATQQGVKGPGESVPRAYAEQELLPFLEAFEVLLEPAGMERAPIGRSLGNYSGMVGMPLGEF